MRIVLEDMRTVRRSIFVVLTPAYILLVTLGAGAAGYLVATRLQYEHASSAIIVGLLIGLFGSAKLCGIVLERINK